MTLEANYLLLKKGMYIETGDKNLNWKREKINSSETPAASEEYGIVLQYE